MDQEEGACGGRCFPIPIISGDNTNYLPDPVADRHWEMAFGLWSQNQVFSTSGTKVPPPTNVVASASHHSATLTFTVPAGEIKQYVVAYREASDTTGEWSIAHQPEEPAATTTTLSFLSPGMHGCL